MDASGSPHPGGVASLQFQCDGTLFGGTGKGTGDLIIINPTTGVFSLVGNAISTGKSLGALAFLEPCPPSPVGGEILSIDTTALFVAGAFTNAYWILPMIGGIAGAVIAVTKVRKQKIEEER